MPPPWHTHKSLHMDAHCWFSNVLGRLGGNRSIRRRGRMDHSLKGLVTNYGEWGQTTRGGGGGS